jgi:ribosomal protein S18 acetylase RimI-like enzyme
VSNPGGAAPGPATVTVERVLEPDASDAAGLARLLPQLSSAAPPDLATLTAIASAPGTSLLLARLDGQVVGSLTLVTFRIPTGVRAIVEDVVVDETVRGRGIGAALVEEALRIAALAGARNVDLTSRPSREAANRLYERVGFIRRETNVWRNVLESP